MKAISSIPVILSLLLSMQSIPAQAANSVRSTDIVDGQVMTVDLADSAVTSAKIQNGQVLNADLASGAFTVMGRSLASDPTTATTRL